MDENTINHLREYLCQVDQFLQYVDDAISSPDLTDFDVLKDKIAQIRKFTPYLEKTIGVSRKDSNASRAHRTESKTSNKPKSSRGNAVPSHSGKQGTPKPSDGSSKGVGKTRGRK